MKTFSMIFIAGATVATGTVTADELGLGNQNNIASTPSETTAETSSNLFTDLLEALGFEPETTD